MIEIRLKSLFYEKAKFKMGELMEEQNKHAILYAATLLCARNPADAVER